MPLTPGFFVLKQGSFGHTTQNSKCRSYIRSYSAVSYTPQPMVIYKSIAPRKIPSYGSQSNPSTKPLVPMSNFEEKKRETAPSISPRKFVALLHASVKSESESKTWHDSIAKGMIEFLVLPLDHVGCCYSSLFRSCPEGRGG